MGFAHRTMLAGLIAGNRKLMRYAIALGADVRFAFDTELALIRRVGGYDVVVGIQNDGRLFFAFEIRHQRLHVRAGNISAGCGHVSPFSRAQDRRNAQDTAISCH